MANRGAWMIYGANGYTGHLVAVEAKRRGLNPVLAGRRAGPIEKLATELGLPARVFDVDDPPSATAALADMAVVANCAGPFAATSAPMIDACLKNSNPLSRYHRRDRRLSRGAPPPHRSKDCWNRNLPRRGLRRDSHRLHGRNAQGGPSGRNPPRARVRCGRINESRYRPHAGAINAARPARRPGAAERSDRGSATRA